MDVHEFTSSISSSPESSPSHLKSNGYESETYKRQNDDNEDEDETWKQYHSSIITLPCENSGCTAMSQPVNPDNTIIDLEGLIELLGEGRGEQVWEELTCQTLCFKHQNDFLLNTVLDMTGITKSSSIPVSRVPSSGPVTHLQDKVEMNAKSAEIMEIRKEIIPKSKTLHGSSASRGMINLIKQQSEDISCDGNKNLIEGKPEASTSVTGVEQLSSGRPTVDEPRLT
ncbi:hypothetical protein M231_03258 [Tremella mesenterica]|uniref:Uncharacterized protein n=1 Tax=Tremella mesenterica TaxID=5217 RepID=A0A4Q1BNH5_TREME|nr:hypothetical protein M231_03258 [Tremella mesenterica]